jgi:hypothetical protein
LIATAAEATSAADAAEVIVAATMVPDKAPSAAMTGSDEICGTDTGAGALCEWAAADFIDSARASRPAPTLAPAPSPTMPAEEPSLPPSLALACSAGCMDSPDKSFADISASAASFVARGSGGTVAAAAPDFIARSAAKSACVGTAGFTVEDPDDDDEEEDADEAAAADWMR